MSRNSQSVSDLHFVSLHSRRHLQIRCDHTCKSAVITRAHCVRTALCYWFEVATVLRVASAQLRSYLKERDEEKSRQCLSVLQTVHAIVNATERHRCCLCVSIFTKGWESTAVQNDSDRHSARDFNRKHSCSPLLSLVEAGTWPERPRKASKV